MSQVFEIFSAGERTRASLSIARYYGAAAVLIDVAVVTGSAVLIGEIYHAWALGISSPIEIYAAAGALMALIYTSLRGSKNGYDPRRAHAGDLQFADMFSAWTMSLLGLLIAGFLTKSTSTYSRGSMLIFYVLGFAVLTLVRIGLVRLLQWGVRERLLSLGRVMLVGTGERIGAFNLRNGIEGSGLSVDGIHVLPAAGSIGAWKASARDDEARILKEAVEQARRGSVDDVFILVPWSDEGQVARCGAAFMTVPARVHLGAEPVLYRFDGMQVERTGSVATLSLARGPLKLTEVFAKRILDIVVASIALVLLSPVLIGTAIAIRIDSPGPILFRQRRNGFNQGTFEILKFRSMTVVEDGASARQATRNDARITRVGRFIRRTSIDELPQLINVLLGSMSIVGPRPHPTNLDKAFEPKIALYARRHNVKPGITGWAQVNGYRGETDTDEKMRSRIDYDLYYIENWSLGFDLYIIASTFLPRTFKNAY